MSESNIFAEQDRKRAEHAERWGLTDLSESDRLLVQLEVFRILREKQIDDDEEKQKVYDDVKRQYLEHRGISRPSSETAHEPKADTAEFERGYKAFWKDHEEIEKFRASQYRQGYEAAEQEWLARRRASKQASIESVGGESTDPIREELQQLKKGFKALDKRINALEGRNKQ